MKPSPSKESLFSEEEETVVWNVDDDDNEAEAEVGLSLFARKRHKASIVQAVSDYDFSEGTESIELAGMDRIAEEVIEKLDAIYAGVNLFDSNGHLALSSRTRDLHDRSFPASTNRVHALPGDSICHSVILNESSDFVSQTMEKDSPSNPWQHEMLYVGHMIENHEGVRVGVVCACLDSEDEVMNENVGSILKKLSIDVMQQLDLRRILMERNISAIQSLQFQNHALARQLKDCCTGASCCKISTPSVVLPACGPLREITTFDVALQEDSPFLSTDLPRRTSTLPIFNGNSANEQEMSHLPDDYFAIADSMSVDRTPVQKNDMERVAAIESFELKEIPHDDATGIALTRTTDMAAELFDCEFSEVTFLSHAKAFSIANHVSCSIEAMTLMAEFKKELVATPEGEPWLCATDRSLAFCNYVAYCEKTFTLQDVWADESFAWVKALKGIRFYSGSPVVVRGLTIATLCVYDFRRAHPEFTRAHQIQQERLAELVSQHLENWVVRQEMGHIRQPVCKTKSLAPEYLAAVVFTKVYGFESLMKADPFAAKESLQLYCQILRDNINDHDGYEVSSEHDSFQIVFQDCHKAISFAIGVQEKLHEAPWCDDILRLPESNDDGKRFRGLRAHCSIKYGPVTTSYGPSGQREYSGQTVNIAKSILDMTHGGQILTTSTFWQMSNMPTGAVQVIDQGRHILLTGTNLKEGLIEKNIVQLLPPRLAVDYATINDGDLKAEGKVAGGRQFPSLLTMRQLSPSFHEAPFDENQTTMMYLFVQQVEKVYDDPETILSSLAKQIETLLSKSQCGYQSSDFLVAFPTLSHAVTFGLTVQTYLRDHQIGGAQLARLIKIGVHAGSFTSLRPHATTGRAEYVGSVVERVALVAEAAHPGEVVVGMIDDNILELESPLESSFVGSRILKGDNETTDLHVCRFS